jgi:hypothetical protein
MSVVWVNMKKPWQPSSPETEAQRNNTVNDEQEKPKAKTIIKVDIDEDGGAKVLDVENDPNIRSILIERYDHGAQVRQKIFDVFNLGKAASSMSTSGGVGLLPPPQFRLNIRLRKKNGRIVPVNEDLKQNTRHTAYVLEVFLPRVMPPRRRPSEIINSYSSMNMMQQSSADFNSSSTHSFGSQKSGNVLAMTKHVGFCDCVLLKI